MSAPRRIAAQAGPQEAFLRSDADIAFYGGAAGGGKSYALLLDPLRHCKVRGFTGVVFRRTSPELLGGGGLWDTAAGLYPVAGGTAREGAHLDYRWSSGAKIEFRHMQHEADKHAHQGRAYAWIGWDEVTHFTEGQFTYLLSRLRTTCGVKPYVRATCNPDADSWVAEWIAWWIGPDGFPIAERSGKKRWLIVDGETKRWFPTRAAAIKAHPDDEPMSVTFIPARLDDNPALTQADPGYKARLRKLSIVDRERLLGGNWRIRQARGLVFAREWFRYYRRLPDSKHAIWIQTWDMSFKGERKPEEKGKSKRDFVVGQVWCCVDAKYYLVDQVRGRKSFRETLTAMRELSAAYPQCIAKLVEDKANGPAVADMLDDEIDGIILVNPQGGKKARANAVSPLYEAGDVLYPEGAPWRTEHVEELVGFPDAKHDDQVDAATQGLLYLRTSAGLAFIDAMNRIRSEM